MALLTGLNRNTVARYLRLIRTRIDEFCEQSSPFMGKSKSINNILEPSGSRKNEAVAHTTNPLSLLSSKGMAWSTEIVPDCAKQTLQGIIRGKLALESVIHSDSWRGYDGLVDLGYKKHYRVHHGANEFANGKRHINGIESFWSYAKRRLMRFHGVPKTTFYFHLKECEFRFTCRTQNI